MATDLRASLNRVKYAGLDFDSFEDEILARLQVQFASVYNDFAVSSLGIMLVDLFSFGLDTLAFYLDRRATDNFLSTARSRASVARASRQLGYKMGSSVASSVDVKITLGQTYPFDVTLPLNFSFNGPNGLTFLTQQSFTWPANTNTTATITCSEGQLLTAVYTSDGTANQVFKIQNVPGGKFIVGPGTNGASPTVVTVAGNGWTESDLLILGSTNQFEIGYNDTPPTLRFGDNVAGNIPQSGSEIKLTFFASSGVNGTATSGTITSATTPLVIAFTNILLTINNPQGTSGGADPETIDSAKANAPLFFKSRGVNVTADDYRVRAGTFKDSVQGAIAVAHALVIKGIAEDAFMSERTAQINSEASLVATTIANDVALMAGGAVTGSVLVLTSAFAVLGTDTLFLSTLVVGAQIQFSSQPGVTYTVATITDDHHLSLTTAYLGSSNATATISVVGTLPAIALDIASIQNQIVSMSLKLADISARQTANDVSLQTARGNVSTATSGSGALTPIISGVDPTLNIKGIIDTIVGVGADQLTAPTRQNLYNAINNANGLNNAVQAELSATVGNISTITTANSAIGEDFDFITQSITVPHGPLPVINDLVADVLTLEGVTRTTALTLNTVVGTTATDIAGFLVEINDHVNSFVSEDCKANLVEVPVLTLDSDGFYVVPTIGLMQSLQKYLDAKKEVTQVVKVIGGTNQLVAANINVLCGVSAGFVEATIRAQVQAAILNALKGRRFGQTLYLDELYGPIAPSTGSIPGLAFVNIKIIGSGTPNSTTHLELDGSSQLTGNLTASETEVITRGVITVTSVIAPAAATG